MKKTDPNRSRTFLVLLVFAIAVLIAAAAQHARMRAGQVPWRTSARFPALN
jgi:hypothetical protein